MNSTDLENLYRQVIMDHYKNPRNKGLKGYDDHVHIKNPSCGDDITVEAKIENGIIKEINHSGSGCSICCSLVFNKLFCLKYVKLHIIFNSLYI